MEKKHKIGISIFLALKIILIISVIYLAFTIGNLKNEIVQTQKAQEQLKEQLTQNQQTIQSQINDISSSLISTKKDLSQEINQLKAETSDDFSAIISDIIPGVVSIGTDVSQGSGFIITNDGYIATNAHVLEGARFARILTYESNKWVQAQLIAYNPEIDIAILKIPDKNYKELKFTDSNELKVGEKAVALGNPLGLSFSVSEGIISSLNRVGPNGLPIYIQIDTPLNPGNSGGPLINKEGKVIGINNFKLANSENLGFAIESNTAIETINEIFKAQNISITI